LWFIALLRFIDLDQCEETLPTPVSAAIPMAVALAEVKIDPEMGFVEIIRHTTVDDVGRAVNPLIIHGQTHVRSRRRSGIATSKLTAVRSVAKCWPARSWTTPCRVPTTFRFSALISANFAGGENAYSTLTQLLSYSCLA
jgi:Molybdopterin-binding domain of aldehyde dehydrogenase